MASLISIGAKDRRSGLVSAVISAPEMRAGNATPPPPPPPAELPRMLAIHASRVNV